MAQSGELVCDSISKKFSNGKVALTDISFRVPTRGIFTLIGRNGAGKTTLTRILATLLEPTTGRATIDGLDVMKDAKQLRDVIAVVPQEGRTVSWMTPLQTISSYLLWRGVGYTESRVKAGEAMKQVGIESYAHRMNATLSGGIKRKVLVAMVLASDARIIFLDEPTTGLDPISRRQLWDVLTELGTKRFVFLTTHYLEEAEEVSDRLAIMNEGKIISMGTVDELRNQLKYRYSLRISSKDAKVGDFQGERLVRRDGQVQIMTTEEEAVRISRDLVAQGARFSLNPVTLDDIFYYIVSAEPKEGEAK